MFSFTADAMFTFMLGVCVKICTSLGLWCMVQQTRGAYSDPSGPSMSFMTPLVGLMLLHEVAGNLTFISMMAFFSRISDPTIGGSYMTLLNTIANLGSKWTSSVALLLLPRMTFHACTMDAAEGFEREKLVFPCSPHDHALCTEHGGKCTIDLVMTFFHAFCNETYTNHAGSLFVLLPGRIYLASIHRGVCGHCLGAVVLEPRQKPPSPAPL